MSHLTETQRYQIQTLYTLGHGPVFISEQINKDKSVVSRELKRNCDQRNGKYDADLAHRKYQKRLYEKPKHIKFSLEMRKYVDDEIKKYYSPEQIVGNAKNENKACVSHERIYQYLWDDKRKGGKLYLHLRTKGKKYRKRGASKDKRGIIPGRVGIENRPEIVNQKLRFGDLEVDTIIGANHKGAIVTINDRVTGVLKMKKVERKEAELVKIAILEIVQEWKDKIFTITSDNGKEFAEHQKISKELNIDFYFAKPYHSWERGANENLNGLIRQYFPKKSNFENITDERIKEVENILNNRPRKRHNFKSPLFLLTQITNNKVAFVT